ncbi:protoporphyrinogen oxidase [Geobacter pelophilus]|uniref:Protoporphyrinogen oxidase n=1 Tax=Geoanaerobacter pelophilus TaxID=60036 RepID=A0AAW4KZL6_9BACT|nr:protoporphyrinogen oxidase [Geoanaerobacter pelophilus]MBT0664098.1 protoporphyrinogen oxidase [Geoanaerobacter pelophilus]
MKRAIVVGGGISGLATAYLLGEKARSAGLELEVMLLEKEKRTGGKILSIKDNGFLCEWGPNGFLDNKPQTLELCRQAGADSQLLRSNDNARKRFIFSEGVLHRLPENGPSFLASKLISWPGKLRLAMEPLIPQYQGEIDETLAAFGRRRLGDEALRKLIAPMVSGIFAGDPETMSLKSCFPRIAELEAQYGGLIKAMIKLAKKKKQDIAEGKVVASAAGPGGVLTSFRGGIQDLTDILSARIGEAAVTLDEQVEKVAKGSTAPYRVISDRGELEADAVVLATPAYATAGMLQGLDAGMAALLNEIPYATMTVVCFGYRRERISRDLDGFGYLIPKQEGKNILGTLWDSSIFENRAPEGHVLLRSMMGGACFPEYINLPDEEVQKRVQADLKTIMGINEPPDFVKIFRHEKAIPQYTVGHAKRLAGLEEQAKAHPGLILTGNSYRGIGLNDCVAAAQRASDEAIEQLKNR